MTSTEKSACVANLPHLHKHTHALPAACCCYGVAAVLRLVLVLLQLPIALPPLLITCNEKTKEKKNVTKSKESTELREGSFPQQLRNFLVGNYGLRRADRWDASISSEVGEI